MNGSVDVAVTAVETAVYRFPTPEPESDGTLTWTATTAVVCTVRAGSATGLGWTYSSPAAAALIDEHLAGELLGRRPDAAGAFERMRRSCRNLGTQGLVMQAISAVDIALWDLRARTVGVPLAALLGGGGDPGPVPVYGSGGFTGLDDRGLSGQVDGWLAAGCRAVKIKIGQNWAPTSPGTCAACAG